MKSRQNILIVSLQGIGNTALLLPVIGVLGRAGNYDMDVAVSNNGSNALMLNNPAVKKIYVWDEKQSGLKNILRLRPELKNKNYDASYAAYPNWTRENAVNLLCHSIVKKGYSGDERYIFDRLLCVINRTLEKKSEHRHDLINNLELFGLSNRTFFPADDCLFYTVAENTASAKNIEKMFPENLKKLFLIGIHPGSKAVEKWWGNDKFSELAVNIANKYEHARFLIFGGSGEITLMDNLQKKIGAKAIAIKNISLRQSARIIKECNLFIGNDSAPIHIAAIQNVPTIAIFGPSDYRRISPIGGKSIVIRKDVHCSPCYGVLKNVKKECRNDFKCIKSITVEEVYSVVSHYIDLILNAAGAEYGKTKNLFNPARKEFLDVGACVLHLKA